MAIERKNRIKIEKIILTTIIDDESGEQENVDIDLKNYFTSITINSSIKDIVVNGVVRISDIDDIISGYRLKGRELLELKITDVNNTNYSIHKYFAVYAIDNIKSEEEVKKYNIKFSSIATILNDDIRFGRRFKGNLLSIVEEIKKLIDDYEYRKIADYDSTIKFENLVSGDTTNFIFNIDNKFRSGFEPTYNHNFVSPMWKPLKLLDYVVSHSLSNVGGSYGYKFCDCLFYEQLYTQNIKTTFVFKSIADTFSNNFTDGNTSGNGIITFKQFAKNITKTEENYYSIDNFEFDEYYNLLNDKQNGLYGFSDTSVDMSHDLSTNIFTGTTYHVNEMPYADIKEELSHYAYCCDIENISPNIQFKYSTNPIYMLGMDCIDCSISESPARYDCLTLPYQRSLVLRKYFDYYKIKLEMDKCHLNLRLGEYVYIEVREKNKNRNSFSKSNASLESQTLEDYFRVIKWVIDGFTHVINNDGTCNSVVTLHTPFLNRKITEKSKLSTHVDTIRSEIEYDSTKPNTTSPLISNSSNGSNASSSSSSSDVQIEKYIAVMRSVVPAKYSQDKRLLNGYYDCSSFVCRCLIEAGFNIEICNTSGIGSALKGCGFVELDYRGTELHNGDILWKPTTSGKYPNAHVITYLNGNQIIGAHSTASGVCIKNFYDIGYTKIYRLSGSTAYSSSAVLKNGGALQTLSGESVVFSNDPTNLNSSLTSTLKIWQRNKNPGNIRSGKSYRKFNTYSEGICEWYNLMKRVYFKDKKERYFHEILEIYAPKSDGNNHNTYYAATKRAYVYPNTKIVRNNKSQMADMARGMMFAETSHLFTQAEILGCWDKGVEYFTD